MHRKPLGKELGKTNVTARLKGWEPWVLGETTEVVGGKKENRRVRGCIPPSVSSWARPPPGTSCRKSLRRQKSRRGLVLLRHCSTAFRKHWGSSRDTAIIFPDWCPAGLESFSALFPHAFPRSAGCLHPQHHFIFL